MELDSSEDAITYFLTDIVPVSSNGVADPATRNKAARMLQGCVALYCEPPWKFKESESTVQFSGTTGLAGLPGDFGTWDRNWGWLVWGPPNTQYRAQINPTKCNTTDVITLRTQYPDRVGTPIAVVMHNRTLKRWPTLPPGGVAENAQIFYHRKRFNILDLYPSLPEPDPPAAQDEWSLIPVEDQEVIVEELLKAKWESVSGDGRAPYDREKARERCRELYKAKNQDQQPARFSQPFRSGVIVGPRIGDRYQV